MRRAEEFSSGESSTKTGNKSRVWGGVPVNSSRYICSRVSLDCKLMKLFNLIIHFTIKINSRRNIYQ